MRAGVGVGVDRGAAAAGAATVWVTIGTAPLRSAPQERQKRLESGISLAQERQVTALGPGSYCSAGAVERCLLLHRAYAFGEDGVAAAAVAAKKCSPDAATEQDDSRRYRIPGFLCNC